MAVAEDGALLLAEANAEGEALQSGPPRSRRLAVRSRPAVFVAASTLALVATAAVIVHAGWRHPASVSSEIAQSTVLEEKSFKKNESAQEDEPANKKKEEEEEEEEEKPKGPPKGCCAWGDHTHCAKPYENCQTGLQGECCSGVTKFSLEVCEKCKGEWISLPQSICDKGHSYEKPLPHIWNYSASKGNRTKVRILSYNLFWWKLFDKMKGSGGVAGKLIRKSVEDEDMPYDFMGFQECQQPYHVLFDAGMDKEFEPWHTNQNICIAWRKAAWKMLEKGERIVANDEQKPGQNFGQRTGMWIRLQNVKTKETVFFMNHHGPLPLSSGGQWGGPATAYNLLKLVEDHAKHGEAVFMVGDFNSIATSDTVVQVGCGLHRVFSGTKFGGVDHIFSNLGKSRVVSTANLGPGGSDHDAISAIVALGPDKD